MFELLRLFFDVFLVFYISLWVIFPAYLTNASAVPISKRFGDGLHPLDGGRMFRGNRLLGDGKTIEGTILSIIAGTAGGLVQILLSPLFLDFTLEWSYFYRPVILAIPEIKLYLGVNLGSIIRAIFFPAGTMLGDILGSFMKRRLRIPRGERAPLLDQLDFVFGVILITLPFHEIQGGSLLFIKPIFFITIIILTPSIHALVNKFANEIGIKKVDH
ncbi:MAG: CDP-2,3-bis-(O-geranylgeranyl)-sn-glycerol synthase [Promethearchaeota archaeon]